MPQIIDTLYGVQTAPTPSTFNSFTVNNAVRKVAIDVVAVAWSYVLGVQVGAGVKAFKFDIQDNFRLLSYGVALPHGFQFANEGSVTIPDGACTLQITGNSDLAPFTAFYLDEVSALAVPFANYEMATDIYVPWSNAPPLPVAPAVTPTFYTLQIALTSGEISMVGVNAILNALVLYPIPFVKILHSLPLST